MADSVVPSVVEKRVRYFDGQFLQDADFTDEQDYQLDREHRHNRLLHGAGITEGLTVTSAGPNQVTVAPGSAIDSDGRQLVLAQATTVDLPAADFNDKQGIELLISYLESAEDPQTVGGSQDFTRWLERPALTALAPGENYSGSYPTVLLITLTLDNAGRVTGDNSARSYSGLRLPGTAADAVTLSAVSGGPAELAGSLTVDDSLGIGTVPGYPLHLAAGKLLRIDAGASASDATSYFSFGGNGTFSIDARNQAGGRLSVLNDGTVGIGTASPGAKLEVVGGGTDSVDLLVNGRLRSNSDDGGLWVSTDRFIGGAGTGVGFWSGNAWRLTVLPNGNTGIGTTSPGTRLEVVGLGGTNVDLLVNGRLRSNSDDGGLWVSADRFIGGYAKNLGLYAGGDWRLSVAPNGNIGIGTGTPGYPLHLATGKAVRLDGALKSDDTTAYFSFGGYGAFNIDAPNTAGGRLTVQNSGSVGIGTNKPGARLEVAGGGGQTVDLLVNGRLRSNSSDGGLWVATDRFVGGDGGTNIGFYAGSAWRFLVAANGNIGVGTSAPQLPLHLATGKGLRIEGGTSATDNASYFSFGGTGSFNIDAPSVGGGRFTVQNSGNVGIGTGSPSSRLHISLPSSGTPVTAMQINVASFVTVANSQASNFLLIRDLGAGDPYVTVRGDGAAYFRGSLNYWWGPDNAWKNIQNRASDYAGSYSTGGPSDIRLKDDVRSIGPALDLVRRLRGVRYQWSKAGLAHFTRDIEASVSAGPDATPEQNEKARRAELDRALDQLSGDRLGLIAQDVELVVPELVHEGEDGYKRIRYQHLTALLTEAIKEQDAVLQALSSEVATLRLALPGQRTQSEKER